MTDPVRIKNLSPSHPATLRQRLLDLLIGTEPGPPAARFWQAIFVVLLLTALNLALEFVIKDVEPTSFAMVYLLGVALSAARLGRWPGLLSALLSVLTFNFAFVEPRLTFVAHDSQYLITFPVMLLVATFIGELAGRVHEQSQEARERLAQTQSLAQLADTLASHDNAPAIAQACAQDLARMFQGHVAVYAPIEQSDKLACLAATNPELLTDPHELGVAQWAWDQGENAGLGTQNLPGSRCLHVPGDKASGNGPVVAIHPHQGESPPDPTQIALIEACAAVLATVLERARLAATTRTALVEAQAERLRGSLLSSVSHDLRTPLAVIAGASESLLARQADPSSPEAQGLRSISDQSRRLASLVENILSVTRLQSGSVHAGLQWVPVDELVAGALDRLPDSGRVRLLPGSGEVQLFADPLLMEQLLYNLLENALKYSPPGSPVEVHAGTADNLFRLWVSDQGPGVPEPDRLRVFEKFVRGSNAGTLPGVGLGLAICQAIASLHHGSITCHGNRFQLLLPQPSQPPQLPDENSENTPI
jgi:two-component system, OmpR family, sensor histidine kinase KdpD